MNYASSPNSLENFWMPFSPNRDFKQDPRIIERAEGVHVWNHHGERLIDSSSGLFCSALGHCHPEIGKAIADQVMKLDYSPPFQFANPLAFQLADMIAEIAPDGINHVFFTNSGSEAIDTAMKIALMYHRVKGEPQRQRFVSRERSYHGVNFGGLSLAGLVKNRERFGLALPGVVHMRHTWIEENRNVLGQGEHGAELADDLQRFVDTYGSDTIAACVVEPIAGSTGVLVPPVGYLERLREICDGHGILLVFDEVICGFGRLGTAFGAQAFAVTPDIMTLAKALTNAAVPMGAVAVRDEIYEAIVEDTAIGGVEFFHGYTYSAHPLACAAGIATQRIYKQENIFQRAGELAPYFLEHVAALKDHPKVTDIRGHGLLAGIDLESGDVPGTRGYAFLKRLFRNGLLTRFMADTLILSPPLVCERAHIDEIFEIIGEGLKSY